MFDQPLFEKQIRFFRVNPQKKQDPQKSTKKSLQFIDSEERRIHEIIRQVLKDFQYFSGYRKEELNLSEGQRVLKMNGIKVIKENETYFIEKYVSKQENILKKKPGQIGQPQKPQSLKVQYHRSETITDPRYMLTLLGYSTKQKEYFEYPNIQCYKCPGYGIQVVMYQDWGDCHYVMIQSVNNYEGFNPVMAIMIEKLRDLLTEENYNDFDPYTLRPKGLKHGQKPEL